MIRFLLKKQVSVSVQLHTTKNLTYLLFAQFKKNQQPGNIYYNAKKILFWKKMITAIAA